MTIRPSSDHEMLKDIWDAVCSGDIAQEEAQLLARYDAAKRTEGQSPRTKAKITENLGLLMEHLRKKYGNVDQDTEIVLFNALSWTADDVEKQERAEAKLREIEP